MKFGTGSRSTPDPVTITIHKAEEVAWAPRGRGAFHVALLLTLSGQVIP